jgi:hypothetical protein
MALSYFRGVTDDEFPGVDLKHVLDLVAGVEDEHVQQRAPDSLDLVSCSCGVRYGTDDPYGESRAHLQEETLRATLRALTGPCACCRGSGEWRKMGGTMTCPDCEGFGRTLFPLKPMQYRDEEGAIWRVTKARGGAALVERA